MKLPPLHLMIVSSLGAVTCRGDDNGAAQGNKDHYIKAELKEILPRAPGGESWSGTFSFKSTTSLGNSAYQSNG